MRAVPAFPTAIVARIGPAHRPSRYGEFPFDKLLAGYRVIEPQFGLDRILHQQPQHGPGDVCHGRFGGPNFLDHFPGVAAPCVPNKAMPMPLGDAIKHDPV